jgi:hypothetical protein
MRGALCLSGAQITSSNELIESLINEVLSVEPEQVLAVGAADLKKHFEPDILPGIVKRVHERYKSCFHLYDCSV